jgi:hypothetical protein
LPQTRASTVTATEGGAALIPGANGMLADTTGIARRQADCDPMRSDDVFKDSVSFQIIKSAVAGPRLLRAVRPGDTTHGFLTTEHFGWSARQTAID